MMEVIIVSGLHIMVALKLDAECIFNETAEKPLFMDEVETLNNTNSVELYWPDFEDYHILLTSCRFLVICAIFTFKLIFFVNIDSMFERESSACEGVFSAKCEVPVLCMQRKMLKIVRILVGHVVGQLMTIMMLKAS
jgi:hypothetical protein